MGCMNMLHENQLETVRVMMLMPMTLVLALQDSRDAHLSYSHFTPDIRPTVWASLRSIHRSACQVHYTFAAAYLLFALIDVIVPSGDYRHLNKRRHRH